MWYSSAVAFPPKISMSVRAPWSALRQLLRFSKLTISAGVAQGQLISRPLGFERNPRDHVPASFILPSWIAATSPNAASV